MEDLTTFPVYIVEAMLPDDSKYIVGVYSTEQRAMVEADRRFGSIVTEYLVDGDMADFRIL